MSLCFGVRTADDTIKKLRLSVKAGSDGPFDHRHFTAVVDG